MKELAVFVILFSVTRLNAQSYNLMVDWEFTSTGEIDIDKISYTDGYGEITYQDHEYDPNDQMDLDRECRKIKSIIPEVMEAIDMSSSQSGCSSLIKDVKGYVANGDLDKAFSKLREKLDDCLPNDLLLLESRYNRTEKKYYCGLVKFSDYDFVATKVTFVFISTLDEILKDDCTCR